MIRCSAAQHAVTKAARFSRGAMAVAISAAWIGLFQMPAANAYVEVDRGPGWVDKYLHYFVELDEFNRTHPCMDFDDFQKARDIWFPSEKDVEDDIYYLDKRIEADHEAIDAIDAKIARIKANYEAALQVSTHTVHNPSDWIAQLEREKDEIRADIAATSTRINVLRGIQLDLHNLYQEILDKPLCKDVDKKDPPPPPPAYYSRCPKLPHVTACKPCKAEVDQVNEQIDRMSWSFGTPDVCWRRQRLVNDFKKDLDACIKTKCAGKRVGYFPGHQLRDGEAYVSFDGNQWCTFGDGVATTAMLAPTDDDDLYASMTPASPPGGPTSDANPTPSANPKTGDNRPLPRRPVRTASGDPEKPASGRPASGTPDGKPPEIELTLPAPDDTPSDIPDNVELKVTQDVIEEGKTGDPIEGQTIKLMASEKPGLPVPIDPKKPAPVRTAEDRGFDKATSQCVTNAQGACGVPVAPDDRPHFHLPELAKGAHQNYRLEVARPLTSGGVAEIKPGENKLPEQGNGKIAASYFSIGNRQFARFSLEEKYGRASPVAPSLKDAYASYEEDVCREKYPAAGQEIGKGRAEITGARVILPKPGR